MTYSLLSGVRVLELSLLAPDLFGMHLADLGADVIKIEQPPQGDYVREIGGHHVGGVSLMHLRWNRGKRSLALNLKDREGRKLLHELVANVHVVIDGLRMGREIAFELANDVHHESGDSRTFSRVTCERCS